MAPEITEEKTLETLVRELVEERRAERRWRTVKRALIILIAVPLLIYAAYTWTILGPKGGAAVVSLDGEIGAGLLEPGKVIKVLEKAFSDPSKVVILRIESPGGIAVAAERIAAAIDHLKKTHKKPVEAVIEGLGASGAYLIAVHADRIHVGQYSLVGSIGAKLSTWDLHGLAERLQIGKRTYAWGPLKDMMDPFKPPSDLEVQKAMALVKAMGRRFAEEVKKARGERLKVDLEDIATGEIWSGVQAVEMGLADDISTLEEVARRYKVKPVDYGPKKSAFEAFTETLFGVLSRATMEGLR